MVVTGLPRHQTGKTLPPALDEVEPLVLAEGAVAVGGGGDVEELGDSGHVALAHLALDLDVVHEIRE